MKVELWLVGKTDRPYLKRGIDIYRERLSRYLPFSLVVIDEAAKGKKDPARRLQMEGEKVLSRIKAGDFLILLDSRGRQFSSEGFAEYMERLLRQSHRRIVFLVGGAYGFSEAVYKRSDAQVSMSRMTFSHQMIRLFFLEQLYRAMTILKNEPYHNR
ncbi:MAG: 23S rRNA (pseudouridine(1915)-N(3))-methyltransferase RlmH [Saprospiraceae bacterium]|nr:23S rRNA (pseudouridine(1915)-N(3))-methyltransferase RlmH [Saprospiraceae bacterium]